MDDVDDTTGQEPEDTTNEPADDGGDDRDRSQTSDELRRTRAEARAMRKERNTLRDQLKQLEDKGKSEDQRTRDALDSVTKERDRAVSRALRYDVAAEVGLPLSMAKRLDGDSRDELVEDAKALKETLGSRDDNGGKQTDFHGGVRSTVKRPQTMNDLLRQAAGRR